MAEVGDGSSAEDDSDGGDDAVPVPVVLMLMPGLMFGLGPGSVLAVFLQNVGHANLFPTVFWQG